MLDIHLGFVLARTLILVTYDGIRAQMQKTEQGSGGSAPEKFLLAMPFRLLENFFSASLSISSLSEN